MAAYTCTSLHSHKILQFLTTTGIVDVLDEAPKDSRVCSSPRLVCTDFSSLRAEAGMWVNDTQILSLGGRISLISMVPAGEAATKASSSVWESLDGVQCEIDWLWLVFRLIMSEHSSPSHVLERV